VDNYYCRLPFQALEIRHNGTVSNCCDYRPGLKTVNFLKNNLDEIFQSQEMSSIRNTMLNENKVWPNCSRCWVKENQGIKSLRQFTQQDDEFFEDFNTNTYQIKELSLKPGNTCNQMCIICDHVNSSMLLQEDSIIFPNNIETLNHHWWKDENKWQQILDRCTHLTRVKIYGGEPLLMKETLYFIQKLIDLGLSKNITLHFATNGSIINENILNMLKQFKLLEVIFSADGVGETFEYCRYPAKWDVFKQNLIDYKQYFKDNKLEHKVSVYYTVSIHNIFNIVESLEEYKHNMREPIDVHLNTVNQSYYHPKCLPLVLKHKLVDNIMGKWKGNYTTSQTYTDILNIFNTQSDQDEDNFTEFLRVTRMRDKMRGNNITNIIPELTEYYYEN